MDASGCVARWESLESAESHRFHYRDTEASSGFQIGDGNNRTVVSAMSGEQRTACLCHVRGWSEKDYIIVWDGSWGVLMKKDLERHLVSGTLTAQRSDWRKAPPPWVLLEENICSPRRAAWITAALVCVGLNRKERKPEGMSDIRPVCTRPRRAHLYCLTLVGCCYCHDAIRQLFTALGDEGSSFSLQACRAQPQGSQPASSADETEACLFICSQIRSKSQKSLLMALMLYEPITKIA